MTLRPMALEVNNRKMEAGKGVMSVWACQDKEGNPKREWACKFSYNPDCTLSPHGHQELVVGLNREAKPWQQLQLVARGDATKALFFEGGDVMDGRWADMERDRAASAAAAGLNVKLAGAVCADPSFRKNCPRAAPGRLSALSVFLLRSILYGAFCMGAQGA